MRHPLSSGRGRVGSRDDPHWPAVSRAGAGPENLAARYRAVPLLLEDEVLETLGEGMALRLPEGGGALPTRASTVLKSATWLAWHATACSALQPEIAAPSNGSSSSEPNL